MINFFIIISIFFVSLEAGNNLNKFTKTSTKAIIGHNDKKLENVTVDECADKCLGTYGNWCVSFDMSIKRDKCYLTGIKAKESSHYIKHMKYNNYSLKGHKSNILTNFHKVENAIIPTANINIVHGISSLECANLCLNTKPKNTPQCKSFDYHKNKQICYLSNKNMYDSPHYGLTLSSSYDHYSLYKKFNDNQTDFEEIPKSDNLSKFSKIKKSAIKTYNKESLVGSREECANECLTRYKDWCTSFDYKTTKKTCYFSDTLAKNIDNKYFSTRDDSPFEYYSLLELPKQRIEILFSEPGSEIIHERIKEYIDLAIPGSEIYMEYYKIDDNQNIISALNKAEKRGVKIDIILDKNVDDKLFSSQIITKKCSYGCIYGKDDSKKVITHQKTILFSHLANGDTNVILQSSSNLHSSAIKRYQDLMIVKNNSSMYTAYFNNHSTLKSFQKNNKYVENRNNFTTVGEAKISTYFLPKILADGSIDTSDNIVLDEINEIDPEADNCEIHIAVPNLTMPANELRELYSGGCNINILTNKHYKYSAISKLRENLGNNFYEDNKTLIFHTKMLLVKYGNKKIVYRGSANMVRKSMHYNDETFIKIEDDNIYDQYLYFWEKMEKQK